MGLYCGALLQRAGHDLHFLLRRDFEAVSHAGLKTTSLRADYLGQLQQEGADCLPTVQIMPQRPAVSHRL